MKKNTMMRVASALLVAVLLTTCAISGTFAKYVSSDSASDTARVAKWGVTVTPNGELFLKNYSKDDSTYSLGDNTVESSDTWNVLAPGTSGNLAEVQLTGTPEVAVRVTYEATVSLENWILKDGTTEYCPIVITVEGATYGMLDSCDNKYDTIAAFEAGVKAAIEGCKKDYAPNTNLSTKGADAPTVSWEWAFAGDDVKDTELGDKAAEGTQISITLTIATTVTQID